MMLKHSMEVVPRSSFLASDRSQSFLIHTLPEVVSPNVMMRSFDQEQLVR